MSRQLAIAAFAGLLGASAVLSPSPAKAQTTDPSVTGQWAKLQNLPLMPIHNHLLPNGKVLMWGRNGGADGYLWDPVTQGLTRMPGVSYDLFCTGHAFLADGRLLVAGGHIVDNVGVKNTSVYDPATNKWSKAPNMNAGRWYPTVTALANGDALVVSGQVDTKAGVNLLPQVYQAATNTWRNLTGAQLSQPLYPMMFLAPNGKVIDVAPSNVTRWLDTSGTGTWTSAGTRKYGWRDYGSAAMYADGKILVVGGGDPPTATAEVIDLNATTPEWRLLPSTMSVARRQLNTTLLPDGTVLVTGGTSGPGFDNWDTPVLSAELWNPATETFTPLASASSPRMYHSSTVLLPDGRVLSNGGDGRYDVELFSPPYLFQGGIRPAMSGVPASIGYGQAFTVQTQQADAIRKVTLIRLASVTHAFNQNQRLNVLQFTPGSGALNITAPANANLAPPGHYMLFIVDSNGVPSEAGIVVLGAGTPAPPPAPTFKLTVTRSGTAATRVTVTSNPSGINCGSVCSATFAQSISSVTLTAVINGNGVFAGWTGCTTSSGNTCTVTMDGDKAVTTTTNRR